MADDRHDEPAGSHPEPGPPGEGTPEQRSDQHGGGDQPYAGRAPAGGPGRGKPGGPPRGGGRSYGERPPGKRPYAGKSGAGRPYAGNKPYANRGGGRPQDARPYADRPRDDRPRDDRPRDDRPGQHERHVEYGQRPRPRGPRPERGPWDRDRGRGRPRPGWEQRDRFAPPRPQTGPAPAEMLGEDEEIVAGRRPVEEAFSARREAKRLLVVPERRAALDRLVLHATTLRIPVVEVEGGTLTAVSGFDGHQGVALVVAPRRWATLDDVLALAKSRGEPPFLLALDHLEDPQNVGTLLRSAEACGVHGVIFPTRGAAPISPAAIKTSAGAVEHLLLVPMPDLAEGLVDLHTRGVRVIGADGDASLTVREADLRGPVVIVTGSEGRGLNARVRKRVDLMARIPMRGQVASLNASVAGSIFLFEAAAQRDPPAASPWPEDPSASEVDDAAPAADAPPSADGQGTPAAVVDAQSTFEDELLPEAPAAPVPDERA